MIVAPTRVAFEVTLLLVVLLLAWHFTGMHAARGQVYEPSSIRAIATFTAETPFQYRLLVPVLVDWPHNHESLHRWLGTRLATAKLVEALSLVGAYFALRAMLREVVGRGPAAVCALGLFYFLPFQYLFPERWPFWYPSDVPGVFFIAAGMLLIRRRAWTLYYPLLALATLNRETACFLIAIQVLVHSGELPGRSLALHFIAQACLYGGIKLALFAAFRDSPGPGLYYDQVWRMNLEALQKPGTALLLASNFGFLWLPLAVGWKLIRDTFARRALLVVPAYCATACVTAQFDEIRLYGEMVPVVLLGAVALGAALLKQSESTTDR